MLSFPCRARPGWIANSGDEDDIWENYLIGFVETELEGLGLDPETPQFSRAFDNLHTPQSHLGEPTIGARDRL